ncbi:hypothetical protein C8F01DRAFT_1052158 [Mycena amicta]|nr:hypothetical protein C8F01DRAFT_1052158 [Mycena amicta]
MSSAKITKRLHVSFAPSIPASGSAELQKSLTAHFGKFGTVKSVDGLGELDGVGQPRKFGFISIEGPEASITKCVNSLSGSIWKGVKVRVGDARPDYSQRIATENNEEKAEPRRKRPRGAVYAEDMELVTPETAGQRAGWKVTEMGRVLRPMRMRPERPLPPPLATETKPKKKEAATSKPKRRRDPNSRARRQTIDVTRWGSVHLKGMFLENAAEVSQKRVPDETRPMEESESSSDEEPASSLNNNTGIYIQTNRSTTTCKIKSHALPQPPPSNTSAAIDLAAEKTGTLRLLRLRCSEAMRRKWGGRESVGSDVDEEELLKIGGAVATVGEDGMSSSRMDVDSGRMEPDEPTTKVSTDYNRRCSPPKPPNSKISSCRGRKILLAGFSLLGHLDLDLELDEHEFAHLTAPNASAAEVIESQLPQPTHVFVPTHTHAPITLDPKQPLFFPLPATTNHDLKARQRDILDVAKDAGWAAHFCKTETEEEIRAKWEAEKVELTRDWTRRWKEAGKMQRRRKLVRQEMIRIRTRGLPSSRALPFTVHEFSDAGR